MSTSIITEEQLTLRKLWTREEAHLLVEIGFPNAEKLELINGDLVNHMGKKYPHVLWQNLVVQWLMKVFGGDFVRQEAPIDVASEDMATSEPEPDLSVTTKPAREFSDTPKPDQVRLVVEISDSTLRFDLTVKAALYSRAGIQEYWVVNVPDKKLFVHREPAGDMYASVQVLSSAEVVSPLACDAEFCLDRL